MDSRPKAKPYEDSLIDAVRERRRKLLEEHGNDLSRLFETVRKIQAERPEKIMKRPASRTQRS